MIRRLAAVAVLIALAMPAAAELRGHGGPVRALAVSPDGRLAVSGSFDQSAILWAIDEGAALAVWRFREGAVDAVAALPDGRFATGGEDGRIALWRLGDPAPERVLEGHTGPIVALAVSADGAALASASWDGTARVVRLAANEPARVLAGHAGNVNGVAFLPDGRLVTAGYDGTLRLWSADGGSVVLASLGFPLNAVAAAADGEIVAAGASGSVVILAADGSERARVSAGLSPIPALALSADGTRIAAATIGGTVTVVERATARPLFSLVGPGLPVWSLAFRPDGRELLTGGADRLVRRWDMRDGQHIGAVAMGKPEDFLAGFKGDRGAEVFQACAACHSLTADGGNRAGPSLHNLYGRRIASLPGYAFSPALKGLDIVWSKETVATLFDLGPAAYTPGTKMPEQRIGSAADRTALVEFLEKATR